MPTIYVFAKISYSNPRFPTLPDGWTVDDYITSKDGLKSFDCSIITNAPRFVISTAGPSSYYLNSEDELITFMETEQRNVFSESILPYIQERYQNMTAEGFIFDGFTGYETGAGYAVLADAEFYPNPANSRAVVFDLTNPLPTREVTAFQTEPNFYNTYNPVIGNVTSVYMPYSFGVFSKDLSKSTSISHYISSFSSGIYYYTLDEVFNPKTGFARVYTLNTNWDYSSDFLNQNVSSGYADYLSIERHPYYWGKISDFLRPNNYNGIRSLKLYGISQLSALDGYEFNPRSLLITGDDAGNIFQGTGIYSDVIHGGIGNDEYYLYRGNTSVYDKGGNNTYYFHTPFLMNLEITDLSNSPVSIIIDNDLISPISYRISGSDIIAFVDLFKNYIGDSYNQYRLFFAKKDGADVILSDDLSLANSARFIDKDLSDLSIIPSDKTAYYGYSYDPTEEIVCPDEFDVCILEAMDGGSQNLTTRIGSNSYLFGSATGKNIHKILPARDGDDSTTRI